MNWLRKLIAVIRADYDWRWQETLSGPIMQRKVNGKIERRAMTEAEEHDYMWSRCGW